MPKAYVKCRNLPVAGPKTEGKKINLDWNTETLLLKRSSGRSRRIFQQEQSPKSKAPLKETTAQTDRHPYDDQIAYRVRQLEEGF